jgi:hypothetical protein
MSRPATHRPTDPDCKVTSQRDSTNGQAPLRKRSRIAQLAITLIQRPASSPRPHFKFRFVAVYLAVYIGTVLLRLAGTGLLTWVAAIHLHLWSEGYRHIPTDGPLFLADAIAGFVLAAVLLVWPRALVGLLGTGFMAATLGALIVSINVGLFGFHESIHASFVVESILLESIGALTLLAWAVIVLRAHPRDIRGSRTTDDPAGPHKWSR